MQIRRILACAMLAIVALPVHPESPTSPEADKTLANLRNLAAAIETFASDHKRYPDASNYAKLKSLITPKYIVIEEEITDGWRHEFAYLVTKDGCHYRLVSAGSDGSFEDGSLKMSPEAPAKRVAKSDTEDLLFQDNSFRWVPINGEFAFELREDSTFRCR